MVPGLKTAISRVNRADWTLFSGAAIATLSPISAVPGQDFRLSYEVSGGTANTGTITATGTLDGTAKTETVTFTAARVRAGTVTFDTVSSITTSGLADEATKPTVVITCIDLAGSPIIKETLTTIYCRWMAKSSGFWGPGGVWTKSDTQVLTTDANCTIGTVLCKSGQDYVVQYVEAFSKLSGREFLRKLQLQMAGVRNVEDFEVVGGESLSQDLTVMYKDVYDSDADGVVDVTEGIREVTEYPSSPKTGDLVYKDGRIHVVTET